MSSKEQQPKFSRRQFMKAVMGATGLAVVNAIIGSGAKESAKASGEQSPTEGVPFGLYDVRNFAPSIQQELDKAVAEGKTIKINGKTFVVDNWGGVLQITDTRGVYAKTSLSVIPDEVAKGEYACIMGISFSRDSQGDALVSVANPNPGHNEPEIYRSEDGFNWQKVQ